MSFSDTRDSVMVLGGFVPEGRATVRLEFHYPEAYPLPQSRQTSTSIHMHFSKGAFATVKRSI